MPQHDGVKGVCNIISGLLDQLTGRLDAVTEADDMEACLPHIAAISAKIAAICAVIDSMYEESVGEDLAASAPGPSTTTEETTHD